MGKRTQVTGSDSYKWGHKLWRFVVGHKLRRLSHDSQLLTDGYHGSGSMSQPKCQLVTGFWYTDVWQIEQIPYHLQHKTVMITVFLLWIANVYVVLPNKQIYLLVIASAQESHNVEFMESW